MLITLLIAISLFAIWNYWRKRVYYRQYKALSSQYVQQTVNTLHQVWADGMRRTVVQDEWPETLDEHIH